MTNRFGLSNVTVEPDAQGAGRPWGGGPTGIFKMPASCGLRECSLCFRFESARSPEEGMRQAAGQRRRVAAYFEGFAEAAEIF
jgi:hypothetical protein